MTYTSADVVPPALAYLQRALVDEEAALYGVDINYGPAPDQGRRAIYLGDSVDEDEIDWASIGKGLAGGKQEFTSTFTVTAVSAEKGAGPQESLEDAYTIRAVAERVIRAEHERGDSRPFDLPAVMAVRLLVARLTHVFVLGDEGVGCHAPLVVRINARL